MPSVSPTLSAAELSVRTEPADTASVAAAEGGTGIPISSYLRRLPQHFTAKPNKEKRLVNAEAQLKTWT